MDGCNILFIYRWSSILNWVLILKIIIWNSFIFIIQILCSFIEHSEKFFKNFSKYILCVPHCGALGNVYQLMTMRLILFICGMSHWGTGCLFVVGHQLGVRVPVTTPISATTTTTNPINANSNAGISGTSKKMALMIGWKWWWRWYHLLVDGFRWWWWLICWWIGYSWWGIYGKDGIVWWHIEIWLIGGNGDCWSKVSFFFFFYVYCDYCCLQLNFIDSIVCKSQFWILISVCFDYNCC